MKNERRDILLQRREEQRKEFIVKDKGQELVRKSLVKAVYSKIQDYATCVRGVAEEIEQKNRKAWLSTYYLTQQELKNKCKEVEQD